MASRCAYAAPRRAVLAAATALSSAQASTAAPVPAAPILDFLLPSLAYRAFASSAATPASAPTRPRRKTQPLQHRRPCAAFSTCTAGRLASRPGTAGHVSASALLDGLLPRPLARPSALSATSAPLARNVRAFSSSSRRPSTHTLFNPQLDDDGNEMRLEITPRAAKRLAKVMAKDGNPRLALRIQVESGGCHGFQYVMSLVTLPDTLPAPGVASDGDEPVVRDDDTIFAFQADGDDAAAAADPLSAPKIILDTPSLELLKGSKVDFTMELIGSQFKITDNPLATSSCGCGTSFDIKI